MLPPASPAVSTPITTAQNPIHGCHTATLPDAQSRQAHKLPRPPMPPTTPRLNTTRNRQTGCTLSTAHLRQTRAGRPDIAAKCNLRCGNPRDRGYRTRMLVQIRHSRNRSRRPRPHPTCHATRLSRRRRRLPQMGQLQVQHRIRRLALIVCRSA